MKEGFYSIVFTGIDGSGAGMLVLDTGRVIGADVGGGTYDGTYEFNEDTRMLDVDVTITIPEGHWSVTGKQAVGAPLSMTVKASLRRDLGAEQPMRLETSDGPVNVVFKMIRDFPE